MILTLACVMFSCNRPIDQKLIDYAILCSKTNKSEIEAVLTHYTDDRANVAEYLTMSMIGLYSQTGFGIDSIEQMYKKLPRTISNRKVWALTENDVEKGKKYMLRPLDTKYDLENIRAEYLIRNIDMAWVAYKNNLWNKNLSIKNFCDLILPYRIGNEKVTDWRPEYLEKYKYLNDTLSRISSSVMAARIIAEAIGETPYNDQLSTPHRSAIDLLEAPLGYCRDDCDRTLYAMRAFGVPVTVDMLLASPDNGGLHQWTVVFDNIDERYRMFDNKNYLPTRDSIHDDLRSKGKVYRQTFSLQQDKIGNKDNFSENYLSLYNPRLKDVTSEYFGHNTAEIEVNISRDQDVYLGIFTVNGFIPIDIAKRKGQNVIFNDIEPNVIFFPIVKDKNTFKACGNPFLINKNGLVHQFIPNTKSKKKVNLTRKMPFRVMLKDKFSSFVGLKIQASNELCGPWKEIYTINEMPISNYYTIQLSHRIDCKYLRVIPSPSRVLEIAEVALYSDSELERKLPITVLDEHCYDCQYNVVVDNDILTWCSCNDTINGITLCLNENVKIDKIVLSPHNDDNFVVPDEEYELLYFDKMNWVSAGRKISNGYAIEFEAPENAALLLLNHTKGNEVQVFVYQNGCQKFSIDRPT